MLGHTSCGAIKGACDHVELGNLTELLSKIQPAVSTKRARRSTATRNSRNPAFVENVADLNVRRSVRTIVNRSYILEHLIEAGKVAVIGAKHDLATGAWSSSTTPSCTTSDPEGDDRPAERRRTCQGQNPPRRPTCRRASRACAGLASARS